MHNTPQTLPSQEQGSFTHQQAWHKVRWLQTERRQAEMETGRDRDRQTRDRWKQAERGRDRQRQKTELPWWTSMLRDF